MRCPSCGNEIPDHVKFCTECGAKTEVTSQNEPQKEKPVKKRRKRFLSLFMLVLAIACGYLAYKQYQFGLVLPALIYAAQAILFAFAWLVGRDHIRSIRPGFYIVFALLGFLLIGPNYKLRMEKFPGFVKKQYDAIDNTLSSFKPDQNNDQQSVNEGPSQETSKTSPETDTVTEHHETIETETDIQRTSEVTASPSQETEASNLVNGMRPEFKEAMDSYEAFYDHYCEILKKVSEGSDLTAMAEYSKMMLELSKMDQDFESWDGNMNDAEAAYYIEVSLRIEKKLLETASLS
mgnify:CR=1 FL=1